VQVQPQYRYANEKDQPHFFGFASQLDLNNYVMRFYKSYSLNQYCKDLAFDDGNGLANLICLVLGKPNLQKVHAKAS
jgi:outer membrane receptor for ferrienterochelin and colicin